MSAVEQPGLVVGMDDEAYHGDPIAGGSLSSTFARLLTKHVPKKAHEVFTNSKPTKAMNLGKAAHRQALGVGPELIVWQYDGRTKAGKDERAAAADRLATEAAVAVTQTEHDHVLGMAAALRADPRVAAIFDDAEHEVSVFWQEGPTWMRARVDVLGATQADDYKSGQAVERREFARAMGKYGYHQQAEFYQRGLRAVGHPAAEQPFRFICQETEPPYLIQIHEPNEEAMALARVLNDRAIDIFTQCSATGVWPGYPELYDDEPVGLLGGYFYDNADVLPPEWQPGMEMTL